MIPKVIHYIWIGGRRKRRLATLCINSWRRIMPEYEIIEWNESNLDIDALRKENRFVDKCVELKLWAFVSDYIRLKILYEHGGIYFDTDVEVVKPFDDLLNNKMFLGTEHTENISSSVIGAEKGTPLLKQLLDFYDSDIWKIDVATSPQIYQYVLDKNPESFKDCKIYPTEYFYEYDREKEYDTIIDKKNTYSNHWYAGNWNSSRKGYVFIKTKHIKQPLKFFAIIKKSFGYERLKHKQKNKLLKVKRNG